MITKTTIAALVAVLVGSTSVALANEQFDVNIYRPAVQGSAVDAFAQSPSSLKGSTRAVKPTSIGEKLMFDRAQGAAD